MTSLAAHDSTALSPEWDRWFDEEFTELVAADEELMRAEFDALIDATWSEPPPPPPVPAGASRPPGRPAPDRPAAPSPAVAQEGGDSSTDAGGQRSPPG